MFKFFKYKKKYTELVSKIKKIHKREKSALFFIKSDNSGCCTASQENREANIRILKEIIKHIN